MFVAANEHESYYLPVDLFFIIYGFPSNLLISCLPLSMWASSLLPVLFLVVGVPTQLAKAAPTPGNMDPNITYRVPPLRELPTAYIDRSSLTVKDGGVLVHYISNNVDFPTTTQAIIVIHGHERDAAREFAGMQAAVEAANKSNVVIMAVRSSFSFLKCSKLINAFSLFSSMGTTRARFRGSTAKPLPIN